MKLSVIIITKNEAATIERAVRSASFADEVLVIDAESTDDTRRIAKASGATVHVRPWPGYGAQKNFGREQAVGDWLFFLDADEEISSELADEIRHIVSAPTVDFYWVKIVTVFLGRPLTHLYGHNPRLIKRSAGRWTDAKVHEQIERLDAGMEGFEVIQLDDRYSQILRIPLWHHSHPTIESYLETMRQYTTLDAQQMTRAGRHRSGRPAKRVWWLPPYLAGRQLVKMMVYRKGILDGWQGVVWCVLSSYYEWVMARKFLRLS